MSQREQAIEAILKKKASAERFGYEERQLGDYFGENVFNERVQKVFLSSEIFNLLQKTTRYGEKLPSEIASPVALAMKEWASRKGVTHFCHWFQPLTDLTAEKHDSLFLPTEEGGAISDFNGKSLLQGEPDASSFPSGGLRTTFEARGYTAWDPSSPAFILGRTLFIPTVFLSWNGEALDEKTPLLRSMEVLNEQALRILAFFGDRSTKRVFPTVGAEQEYFLIDQHFLFLRPDIISCGRTLFGSKPAKGQELEDQYLGLIPERILAFMEEAEFELMRLGVPIKTRHNEVAPSQYELANSFESAQLASDHHMLVMRILRMIAHKHGLDCLLHEKPFAGINGSGKHTNWSLATDTGKNLLDPGSTPGENAQFLLFCAAVIRSVYKYSKLLRMSVATAGNDHRLGKHEAPPGIMSVFLGDQLFNILQSLIPNHERPNYALQRAHLQLGVSLLPTIPRHSSDRNRTSPFAFTGNKFEFRAVGAGENIAKACTVLNTIVAESLDFFASELEKREGKFNEVLQGVLAEAVEDFQAIIYEGDNYSPLWHQEAARRGLPNITNAVDAAQEYTLDSSLSLFKKYNIFSQKELESRKEIALNKYVKKLVIEARSASNIVHTLILPAVLKYIKQLGETLDFLPSQGLHLHNKAMQEFTLMLEALNGLDELLQKMPEPLYEKAIYARDQILPAMEALRSHCDCLEEITDDSFWPLPKYWEMLFIN